MSKRKAFHDENTDHLGFTDLELTEMFHYTEQNGPMISISILRPLFSAIDELFADQEFEIFRVRGELNEIENYGIVSCVPYTICFNILQTCFYGKRSDIGKRIENMWISKRGPGSCKLPLYGVHSVHSYGVYMYRCIRRVVFATDTNCLLPLEHITKDNALFKPIHMSRFPNHTIEDIIPALVGLLLWRNASIYYQVQALQQSHLQHIRETTHKFTDLLRPLAQTFESIEGYVDPDPITLFSSRKRCTKQQMKLLRDNMHGDTEKTMNSTLQSFMSTSTSKRFCTQFHEVDCQEQECEYEMPPMLMTITVEPEAKKLRVFIPVYWFLIEKETGQSTHESEVLVFPGVKMEFHTLRCQPEDECGPKDAIMTMCVKIIGFEPDKSALNSTPHTGCQVSHSQFVHNLGEALGTLMVSKLV
jgi:hypothetical protein